MLQDMPDDRYRAYATLRESRARQMVRSFSGCMALKSYDDLHLRYRYASWLLVRPRAQAVTCSEKCEVKDNDKQY